MSKARYNGLDNWRAILLAIGPLIHGAQTVNVDKAPWLNDIADASHLFRMGSFFMIAGFLAAHNQAKDLGGWLGRRMRQVLVPMLSLWLLVSIPLDVVLHYAKGAPWDNMLSPGHLWFLMTLAVVTPIGFWFDRSPLYHKILYQVQTRPVWSFSLVLGFLMGSELFLNVALHVAKPLREILEVLGPVFYTPRYLVIYLMGFMVQRSTSLTPLIKSPPLWVLGGVLWASSMVVLHYMFVWGINDPSTAGQYQVLKMACKELTVTTEMVTSCMVLASALAWTNQDALLGWMSKRAYTVYLFHVLFLGLLTLTPLVIQGTGLMLALFTAVSLGGSLLVHEVISRSSVLMFLFNGREMNNAGVGTNGRSALEALEPGIRGGRQAAAAPGQQ